MAVLIPIPSLSEERRVELTKFMHKIIEEGRIAVRNVRRDALHQIHDYGKQENISEDEIKGRETELQKITDGHIKELNSQNIKLNITAVYTVSQVRKIIKKIDKNSKTIISIFAGRMSDVGKDPVPIIKESVRLTKKLKNVKILCASTREAYNYLQAK